ncbi:EamA family transporter, partial [Streptomyces sp. SID5926]|nr:EamA family transporter [Streptomyces sp. SID5926]
MSTSRATPGTSSPAAAAAVAPAVGHASVPDGAPGGRFGALGPVGLVLAGGVSV